MNTSLTSQNGFSLIQVMVAAAIAGVLGVTVMSTMQNSVKSTKSVNKNIEWSEITQYAKLRMGNREICGVSLNQSVSYNDLVNALNTSSSIDLSINNSSESGDVLLSALSPSTYQNNLKEVRINKIQLQQIRKISPSGNHLEANVYLEGSLRGTQSSFGTASFNKVFPLSIYTDPATSTIKNCAAFGEQAVVKNDICVELGGSVNDQGICVFEFPTYEEPNTCADTATTASCEESTGLTPGNGQCFNNSCSIVNIDFSLSLESHPPVSMAEFQCYSQKQMLDHTVDGGVATLCPPEDPNRDRRKYHLSAYNTKMTNIDNGNGWKKCGGFVFRGRNNKQGVMTGVFYRDGGSGDDKIKMVNCSRLKASHGVGVTLLSAVQINMNGKGSRWHHCSPGQAITHFERLGDDDISMENMKCSSIDLALPSSIKSKLRLRVEDQITKKTYVDGNESDNWSNCPNGYVLSGVYYADDNYFADEDDAIVRIACSKYVFEPKN